MWQLAKFIDPKLSVFQKLVWVQDLPEDWITKHSVDTAGNIVKGEDTATGFATNVLGDDDRVPMVAYLHQIELLAMFADKVCPIEFRWWVTLSGAAVRNLKSEPIQSTGKF